MNTGLQDAYNLAWKLALVVSDRAQAALLDSYEQERLPVARRLLNTTDRAFRLVVSDSWLAGLLRTKVLARIAAFAMRREAIQRFAFRTVSQTGIHYRASALSQSQPGVPDGAPRAGDRFPWLRLKLEANGPIEDLFQKLDDRHFNLLAIGQPSPPKAPCTSATSAASTPSPPTPPTTPSWPAPRSPTPPSTCCAPTAMSAYAEVALGCSGSRTLSLGAFAPARLIPSRTCCDL